MASCESNGARSGVLIRRVTQAANFSSVPWPMEFRRKRSAALTQRPCNSFAKPMGRNGAKPKPRRSRLGKDRSSSGNGTAKRTRCSCSTRALLARRNLPKPKRDRSRYHRGALERLGFLWPEASHKGGAGQCLRRAAGEPSASAAPFIPENLLTRGLSQEQLESLTLRHPLTCVLVVLITGRACQGFLG